jgi:hypothetical protein
LPDALVGRMLTRNPNDTYARMGDAA